MHCNWMPPVVLRFNYGTRTKFEVGRSIPDL